MATGLGFLVMGFIGFFVKLMYSPTLYTLHPTPYTLHSQFSTPTPESLTLDLNSTPCMSRKDESPCILRPTPSFLNPNPSIPNPGSEPYTPPHAMLLVQARYRGASLIRNTGLLGPYSWTIPRVLWWS